MITCILTPLHKYLNENSETDFNNCFGVGISYY